MNVEFQDLQENDNPRSGDDFARPNELLEFLDKLACSRPPFMCELIGDNGFTITVGIGGNIGCVQHSRSDGNPPYLMAVDPAPQEVNAEWIEFLVGGTLTPVNGRYCIPFSVAKKIVAAFVASGYRTPAVNWEEI